MANWMKIGQDLGVGGVAGVLDQILQEEDEKRAKTFLAKPENAAKKTMPVLNQYGTYFNYGLPIVTVVATAMGYLNGPLQTEMLTASGALVGRKAIHYVLYKDSAKQANRGIAPWQAARAKYEITSTNETLGSTLLT